MGITDELRKYARGYELMVNHKLLEIADRIDVEHERQLEVLRRDMSDAEYVKLPVDANGVPICIGDVMEWCDSGETLTVEGIGNDVLFYIDGENAEWTTARNKRHYHEMTVEDVLPEFSHFDFYADPETIAECAARLRMADGGKEQQ